MNPRLDVDWDTEYRTLEDYELDSDGTPIYVKKVEAADPYVQPNFLRIEAEKKNTDDGARLDTTQARRLRDLERIASNIEEGLVRLNLAHRDADNLSRMERVVDKLGFAIAVLHEAEDALDMERER